MGYRFTAPATVATLATLLTACAAGGGAPAASTSAPTGTPAQQAALARYTAYAGPPVDSFTWLGQFYSWEALGKDRLVVFTVPDQAYLLKVWPPCDLSFVVNAIGITSTARTVYARLDSITVNSAGTGPGRWRCPIEEIRKVDYKRMRADQRAQARENGSGAPAAPPPSQPPQR